MQQTFQCSKAAEILLQGMPLSAKTRPQMPDLRHHVQSQKRTEKVLLQRLRNRIPYEAPLQDVPLLHEAVSQEQPLP